MSKPGSSVRELLEEFRSAPWERVLEVVEKIGETGDVDAVPALMSCLLGANDDVAAKVAQAIERIVGRSKGSALVRLDWQVRDVGEWQWPPIVPRSVDAYARGLTGAMGVLSCHPSGYVREAAVESLERVWDGAELPFLLIRLNDWVEPVRDKAKIAVLERLRRTDYARHVARWLPLALRLEALGRDDHGGVIEAALRMLREPAGREALRETIAHGDREAARTAFRFLLGHDSGKAQLLAEGLRANDELIRLAAAREARQSLDGKALQDALARTKVDRFMPVRREALYGYVERLPEAAPAELTAALFDRHASVREAARSFLRSSGVADVIGIYRARLKDGADAELAIAVAGLGETGGKEHTALIDPFLGHAAARVRRAAVRAIVRLDPEDHVEQLLAALADPAAAVAKAARDALRGPLFMVPARRLLELLQKTRHDHVQRAVLRLAAEKGWWDSAPLLLAGIGAGEGVIRNRAFDYLARWRKNSDRLTARPTAEQLALLETMRRRYGEFLDKVALDDLDAHLAFARRNYVQG